MAREHYIAELERTRTEFLQMGQVPRTLSKRRCALSATPTERLPGELTDEMLRLQEYSPGFAPERFAAHDQFIVEDVRRWTELRFGGALPPERTAVFGASAGRELALALGLPHPDVYGAVFCASPGGGYKPPGVMPSPLPRTYKMKSSRLLERVTFHNEPTRRERLR
jgi:pimeloyl-ACP methyl ester carboxylesterase